MKKRMYMILLKSYTFSFLYIRKLYKGVLLNTVLNIIIYHLHKLYVYKWSNLKDIDNEKMK